jgi:hypothetical protein
MHGMDKWRLIFSLLRLLNIVAGGLYIVIFEINLQHKVYNPSAGVFNVAQHAEY